MKKLNLLTIIIMLAFASLSFGQGISNSAHNFASEGWNPSGEICITCHTPHNADITDGNSPLWNHEVTAATFTLYSSTSMDATDLDQPDAESKMCLSCHDGTVALDNFGGVTTGTNDIGSGALIDTDISDDHPISFTYSTAYATDTELEDPANIAGMLFNGKMQCSSCHDVHDKDGNSSLLVMENTASALCLTCHKK